MKGVCITFLTCIIIILAVIGGVAPLTPTHTEYLRIHIRANSNDSADQAVKYQIRNQAVQMLTPALSACKTKQRATEVIKDMSPELERAMDNILKANGFNYSAKVKLKTENFPTRTYGSLTLNAGYYDAVIVELGSATGDNWWCVVYPPLCFVDTGASGNIYKSKILEIINDFFKNKEK